MPMVARIGCREPLTSELMSGRGWINICLQREARRFFVSVCGQSRDLPGADEVARLKWTAAAECPDLVLESRSRGALRLPRSVWGSTGRYGGLEGTKNVRTRMLPDLWCDEAKNKKPGGG
jgi:hypothetical protein